MTSENLDKRSPTFWTSSMTDFDLENMPELERLRYINDKLKRENEMLKLDCESYITLMNAERGKNSKKCQELEEKITYLSEVVEAQKQSKGLFDVLNNNIGTILMSERELKVIYQTQQEVADRAMTVYGHLSALSKKFVDKMDEIEIETNASDSTFRVDDKLVEENFFLKSELEFANITIHNQDLEIKELKSGTPERTNSTRETGFSLNNEETLSLNESKVLYEGQLKRYEAEIGTLKNIIRKLTEDKEGISLVPKDDNGQIAVLTSRLVMARLTLGELNPTEAYRILEEANALATYTMEDLNAIYSNSSRKKKNPMKKLRRIFSSKRSMPEPMLSVPEYEES
ncbi:hypothetical protein FO519_005625 [Halicephalobus sp. NKZ332]|nr:hypothetical protein FO519_005625 [Halicephalobus sp. NKZ332]